MVIVRLLFALISISLSLSVFGGELKGRVSPTLLFSHTYPYPVIHIQNHPTICINVSIRNKMKMLLKLFIHFLTLTHITHTHTQKSNVF
jgi:hypothetical protein